MTSWFIPPNGFISGEFVAPSGTVMPFHTAAPPLGWTQNVGTGFSDASMRATNAGLNSGGSTAWSTWNFGGTVNCTGFTLNSSHLPSHTHAVNDPGHAHTWPVGMWTIDGAGGGVHGTGSPGGDQTTSASTNNDANLSTANSGTNSTITPTFTTPQVKFTTFCVATKA